MSKKATTKPGEASDPLQDEIQFLKAKLKTVTAARAQLLTFISDMGMGEKFRSYERAGWIKPPAGFLSAAQCLWAPLTSYEAKN